MLYLVCPDGIETNEHFIDDDDNCFVISVKNDGELAAKITKVAVESGLYDYSDINGSKWVVRKLSEDFEFQISNATVFNGKRL